MNHPTTPVLLVDPLKRGRVTRERVYARTRELAVKAGRPPWQVSQIDYEQARLELTGESDMARQEAVLDAAPIATPASSAWENEGGRVMAPSDQVTLCKKPRNLSPNASSWSPPATPNPPITACPSASDPFPP